MLIQAVSAAAAAVAMILGAVATVLSRRTESKSATREEIDQALEAQGRLLDRYEKRIALLETTLETAVGKQAAAEDAHRKCEDDHERCQEFIAVLGDRLHVAEARIAELGG